MSGPPLSLIVQGSQQPTPWGILLIGVSRHMIIATVSRWWEVRVPYQLCGRKALLSSTRVLATRIGTQAWLVWRTCVLSAKYHWISIIYMKKKNVKNLNNCFILITCGSDNVLDMLGKRKHIIKMNFTWSFLFYKNMAAREKFLVWLRLYFCWTELVWRGLVLNHSHKPGYVCVLFLALLLQGFRAAGLAVAASISF